MRRMASKHGGRSDSPTVEWLLEEENPCIRYLALTKLLGCSGDSRDAMTARAKIPLWPPVKTILSRQKRSGGWDGGRCWYLPKYKSTVWQLILLSQTGIDPGLPAIRKMCEYSFRFQRPGGAFVSRMNAPDRDWAISAGCLNGNVLASLCRLGWSKDRRVRMLADYLVSLQELDGGWGCRSFGYHVKDKHSCFMGTICALEGLNEFGRYVRGRRIDEARRSACEFLLMHRLFRADHHEFAVINKDWTILNAPWRVGYGILRGLNALVSAGTTDDPRMADAMAIVLAERQPNGSWIRKKPWPSNTYSSFGRAGSDDKWITLSALIVLSACLPDDHS